MKSVIISEGILEEYRDLLSYKNRKLKKISRGIYNSSFSRFFYRDSFPIFLDNNAYHERDLENISKVCKRKGIKKDELSVVIADEHTDMYDFGEDAISEMSRIRGIDFKNKAHGGNWVLELINQGYSDISLVGVRDFTHSGERSLYSKYDKDVSFYLGPGFDQSKHFNSEDFNNTKLQSLEDFFSKKDFKPYTFISLDCDVSQELIGPNDSNHRKCGDLSHGDLARIMDYIKGKSEVVGLSVFGEGRFFGTFVDARDKVNEVISDFS